MTLNGWQRLWLVLAVLWGITIATFATVAWPRSIAHPPSSYSEEVVSQMQVKDWKGKDDCSGLATFGPPSATPEPPGWTLVQRAPVEGGLHVVPDNLTVAYVIREAYPDSYNDLSDAQLEDAVRSKSPELDRMVRSMISERVSLDNIVLIVHQAAKSGVKGTDDVLPLFSRVHIAIDGDTVLCFSGERKDRASQIVADYVATHARILKSKRRETTIEALAFWLIPIAFTYALGWSIGWIRRGFKMSGQR